MSNLRTAAAELIESLKDPSDLFRINKAIGNVNTALSDLFECPKCHETNAECRCLRGKCDICGKPLGKITYTFCDECWESEPIEGKVKAEAVKLPRRMYNPFNQETTYNSAWNACIEELKKLNPNANFITE